MTDGTLWYFAYGSNMAAAIFLERRGMQPLESTWGWLDGFRLCFDLPVGPGERGVANVVDAPGSRTCGVLYRISTADADRLDLTEGVHRGYYRRLPVDVTNGAGTSVDAFTYQSPHGVLGRKPSERYLGLLLDGARAHGLPGEWIALLDALERAVDERTDTSV